MSHAPWDALAPHARGYFDALGDGLVVIVPPIAAAPTGRAFRMPNGGCWLHVGASGVVTAFTGKVEVGQGTRTALSLLVAEELRVALDAVRLVMGDTDQCPWDVGTFGSRSLPDGGEPLRAAAATARETLVTLAAAQLGASPDELVARDGNVRRGARAAAYAELVRGLRRIETAPRDGAPVTPASDWTLADRPTPLVGAVDVVTGAKRFPSDLAPPGVLHGRVLRAPAVGATLRSADVARARAMPGVTVVADGAFIAVAAEDLDVAAAALAAIDATWDFAPQPPERDLEAWLRAHPSEGEGWWGATHHEAGDVDASLAGASVRLEATYTAAYIAHVALECRAAIAEWRGERVTITTGTQVPFGVRDEVAEALGLPVTSVRVLVPDAGGGFGGKHTGECAAEAAKLARTAGRPVKIAWTREE